MTLFNQLIPFRRGSVARPAGADAEDAHVVPAYELKESADAFGLEVFLPGVGKDGVHLDVEKGELVITGRREWKTPEGWTELFRESLDAGFRLRLDLNDAVNVDAINAEHENGVLRVTLPKAEALKPRRIEIN